ncbi:MAG: hypothetical protein QOH33_705 [Paraburkholderia sp.]|nr:hypothetical protein [Paraburkholderia sp.]
MPRFLNDALLWQALLARSEARLMRARHEAAAAAHIERTALDALDAARLALVVAERQARERRGSLNGEQHSGRDFRRSDLERICEAHSRVDRMIEDARASVTTAQSQYEDARRSLCNVRSACRAHTRQCEKYRFACERLTRYYDDDIF